MTLLQFARKQQIAGSGRLMEIQCPSCKKSNIDSDECVRCGCRLDILMTIIQTAQQEYFLGVKELCMGNSAVAIAHANRSWHLKKSIGAARLGFLASIKEGRFKEAFVWREKG